MNLKLIQAESNERAWIAGLKTIFDSGTIVSPRGMNTLECQPLIVEISNPKDRLIYNPVRKWNLGFAILEWLWIMNGRNEADRVTLFNRDIGRFSDDGKTFHGAYGQRLIHHNVNQINNVISALKKDHNSRQALVTIYDHVLDNQSTKDVCCTISLAFMIRDEKLDLIVNMRSNDMIRGFPYDVFNFTMMQEIIANELGIEMGKYTHISNSMHIYESDFIWAKRIIDCDSARPEYLLTAEFKYEDIKKLDELISLFLSPYEYETKKRLIDLYCGALNELPQDLKDIARILEFYYAVNMRDFDWATEVKDKVCNVLVYQLYNRRFSNIIKEAK